MDEIEDLLRHARVAELLEEQRSIVNLQSSNTLSKLDH